jgi:hypothetical protein
MTTNIIVTSPSNEELISSTEHHQLLRPSLPTFEQFPSSLIHLNETDRRRGLPHSRSASNFLTIKQSSFDISDDDDDLENTEEIPRKSRPKRSPSDIRIDLYPDTLYQQLTNNQIEISSLKSEKDMHNSIPSLDGIKTFKQTRVDYLRRTLLDHRFSRRIHSSFSSSITLRSLNRRRSPLNLPQRSHRRHTHYLPSNSKWHFVRKHLHVIAMMSESYARMKLIEQDLRWAHLREQIRKQVLDMREMSILRQQDDGILKKTQKTSFDLKAIPIDEVVHVERDGHVYSIGTRDLVLGRLIGDEDIKLDTFVQLDARRKFQVKQSLLRRQEGRTRLKKHIAFSFCICNLSFIVLMFATMFIFAVKTIIELRSRELF